MSPIFDSLAKENKGAVFLKIDVDEQKELAKRYGITAMPTFIALKDKEARETLKCEMHLCETRERLFASLTYPCRTCRGADPAGLKKLVQNNL